jgi:hypothetical protein
MTDRAQEGYRRVGGDADHVTGLLGALAGFGGVVATEVIAELIGSTMPKLGPWNPLAAWRPAAK